MCYLQIYRRHYMSMVGHIFGDPSAGTHGPLLNVYTVDDLFVTRRRMIELVAGKQRTLVN